MTSALALAIVACLPWLIKAGIFLWKGGVKEGQQSELSYQQAVGLVRALEVLQHKLDKHEDITRKEIDELVKSVSLNNDLSNTRYHEFYREFSDFKYQVGRFIKNGEH
jgi:hypothetical protein